MLCQYETSTLNEICQRFMAEKLMLIQVIVQGDTQEPDISKQINK